MIRYILRKSFYGLLVLWGVVTLVFLIFNLKPGDPARLVGGQHVTPEILKAINKDLNLDLPVSKQYLLYLNDVSPLSIHAYHTHSRIVLDGEKYTFLKVLKLSDNYALALKFPYLRRSYQSRKKVSEIILEAFPGTLILATVSIAMSMLIGITIGVISALNKNSVFDQSAFFISVLGMSGPSFFMAILISWLGGYVWYAQTSLPAFPLMMILLGLLVYAYTVLKSKERTFELLKALKYAGRFFLLGLGIWIISELVSTLFSWGKIPVLTSSILLPGTGLDMTGSLYAYDVFSGREIRLQHLILPVLTLGIRPLSVVIQLMRNSLLDVMEQDYIRTARAKGLSTFKVIWNHALRNALNPVITAMSGWFASLLAGAVFIEFVFGWKGLGLELYNALTKDDLPVVMGAVLFIAVIFVILNIVVDIVYGILDPRVRIN